MITINDIIAAESRVRLHFAATPLTLSIGLSEKFQCEIYLKWESNLITGSFKERGAINFLAQLSPEDRSRGVCAASAGNHALALSYYARKFALPCTIVMPIHAPLVKVQSTRSHGAEVILHGNSFHEAYEHAQQLSMQRSLVFVPPYDHQHIVAGQGTAGLEIVKQLNNIDAVIVPVGGGGLISGIAEAVSQNQPQTQVIGVESEWANALRQGKTPSSPVVGMSIADGIAVKTIGKVPQSIIAARNLPIYTVSENLIAEAIMDLLRLERSVVEGAGAAGLAYLLQTKFSPQWKKIVVVISGSNIDLNLLSRLIDRSMAKEGRLVSLKVSVPDLPGSLHMTTGIIAKAGGNILQVLHDRSFSLVPANVDITFMLEVRDSTHQAEVIASLEAAGLGVVPLTPQL